MLKLAKLIFSPKIWPNVLRNRTVTSIIISNSLTDEYFFNSTRFFRTNMHTLRQASNLSGDFKLLHSIWRINSTVPL